MTFGSLFSGIGGMDLGLERAGMTCKWQVEIDPFCQRVLAKHWPGVKRYGDIRAVGSELERVDLIAGGFPCQDVSHAGNKAGLDGEQSGLWFEYARIIRHIRPRIVLVENVSALLVRGIDRVLGELAASGYSAEWQCLPAAAFGAPHIRDRVFILGYSDESHGGAPWTRKDQRWAAGLPFGSSESNAAKQILAHPQGEPIRPGLRPRSPREEWRRRLGDSSSAGDAWTTEPTLGRVADGVPDRVDRLRGLGNAVVPQVAEWIGRRIMEASA